jgi:hypothetical protein
MSSTHICGLDPGKTGGYGIFNLFRRELVFAAPFNFDRPQDLLFDLYRYNVSEILIERAQAARGDAGQFEYGRAFGRAEGAALCSDAKVLYCAPVWWKSRLSISTDKAEAYAEAMRRWPNLRRWAAPGPRGGLDKVHGMAEGCLIGSILMSEKLRAELEKNNAARVAKPKRRKPLFNWKGD